MQLILNKALIMNEVANNDVVEMNQAYENSDTISWYNETGLIGKLIKETMIENLRP